MFLIVGLGNPGRRYEGTRHNAGFMVLERLAAELVTPLVHKKFSALAGRSYIGETPVLLVKPQTFMNLSGEAVGKFFEYYRLEKPEKVIVVHDDLDLPFTVLRLKAGGGHGGHRGLMSVIQHLGGPDFSRVRVGIGKPAAGETTERYVLEPFSDEEMKRLPQVVTTAAAAVKEIVTSGIQTAMNKYNGSTINNFCEEV
ncbi:MAG TPA: aminoacyl-tRNA hydrolase [Syntrophales bacterium]|nr:aminoacyl-tRNA hydrolase [Syntrophales bacterium]HPC32260.1 aminoacyl-tRNA hydrolase [Syntrophales bacterium]HQG34002.1 aminoacyl-tRNA hydrolase [Syntrophales bacterium]HQI35395.1 aminoacyl-tRNA hydrolase [Syntrophales bacterium]HRR46901.1 aminoacyl-tRNA hydrolase [Syntrophales bacterium]